MIYRRLKGSPAPKGLDIGTNLGQFEHEKSHLNVLTIKNDFIYFRCSGKIHTFSSSGAKSYALSILEADGKWRHELKCKGFSANKANPEARGGITADAMSELVLGDINQLSMTDFHVIRRDMTRMVLRMIPECTKKLTFTANQKRYLLDKSRFNYSTVPFGFIQKE